ncbi:S1C family serine protease [Reinekea sp.]|uniref:S1C family serine protease n=1 Tax=Reinekea sp. TaxID=1970455 RepID=UPI002A8089A8|nr:trypsin-like peptidase domain-containing protein [Reinekea sp.]
MPILIGALVGLLLVLWPLWSHRSPPDNSVIRGSYADILEPVLPYAVSILTNRKSEEVPSDLANDPYFSKYFDQTQPSVNQTEPPVNQTEPSFDPTREQTTLGSGIVLSKTGLVVTNAHVVRSADNIIILTHLGRRASVIRTLIDPETDIAVLETDLRLSRDLPMGLESPVRVGDIAFTIGNPFGIGQSVSMGVISATGRQQPGLTTLTDFIQTDAAINPGNSGGPLVNAQGQVIGMNTAIFSSTGGSQGIGFAIPFGQVKAVADELSKNGLVSRGYLGIDVAELTPKQQASLGHASGGLSIVSVKADSPAADNDIRIGDVLLTIDGAPVSTRTKAVRLISQLMPGKGIAIDLLRGGVAVEKRVFLSQRN